MNLSESDRARFEAFVYPDPNSGCYIFAGSWAKGYGKFRVGSKVNGTARLISAHYIAWWLAGRIVPPGLWLLHKCDFRCCVNVDHLFLGTQAINSEDMSRKGRGRKSAIGLPFGVCLRPNGRFMAQARIAGTMRYLGMFATIEDAHRVAVEAKRASLSHQ